MRLVDQSQAQQIDQRTQSEYRIHSKQLMSTAVEMTFQYLLKIVKVQKNQNFLFLIGPGNNGQDGLLLSEKLKSEGFLNVDIFNFSLENKTDLVDELLQKSDWIIDAIFGIGLSRPIQPEYLKCFDRINFHSKKVFSLDIPSGLHATTGKILGHCIKAEITFNFGPQKIGQYIQSGPDVCGKIISFDIGFPQALIQNVANEYFAIGACAAQKLLPKRKRLSNKSQGGRVLVVAGSKNMMGAAFLSAKAALRVGAGYVTVMSLLSKDTIRDYNSANQYPEVLWKEFDLNLDWHKFDAILIGPGLGLEGEKQVLQLIQQLIQVQHSNVILDADALTICANEMYQQNLPSSWILTPHEAEMARLIKKSTLDVHESRFECLNLAVKKWNTAFVLKGSRSIIASQNKIFVNLSGNSALAKSGTGDVLAGILLGLLAQIQEPTKALCLSVYLHGRCSDEFVADKKDHLSLLPTDLIEILPKVIHDVRTGIKLSSQDGLKK